MNRNLMDQQHFKSLVEIPEEEKPLDLQQDFYLSVMNGICSHCKKELKHMELTDLFRYKLLHKDEPFVFDSEVCKNPKLKISWRI